MRMKLAVLVMSVLAAIAVTGASAADFETDDGPCPEGRSNPFVLACPTAYVGEEYEIELESEDGSGCEPYNWFEVKNGSLPAGLSMTTKGVISGTPAGAGLSRFWVWNHDITFAEGGPDWCQREDLSEKEFSIHVDPGLAILNEEVEPATIGEPYSETFQARQLLSLNPPTGPTVQASWTLFSGALPPGITLSASGALSGTPTSEGSYQFVVRGRQGGPIAEETFTLSVRQPLVVRSPFIPTPRASAEVGVRFGKKATATGGSGTYTWSLSSGALPGGLTMDENTGTISGTPRAPGAFTFGLTATDAEGREETVSGSLTVAPRLAIRTLRLKSAKVGRAYRAKLATTGGVVPTRWRVVSGKLPAGIRLSQRLGTLAGVPSRSGSYRVTVEARDALGVRSKKALMLVVNG